MHFWVGDFCTNGNCKHRLQVWSEADSGGSLILTRFYMLRSTEFGCRHIRCCFLCWWCATRAGSSGAAVEIAADVLISSLVKTFFISSPLKNIRILLLGKYMECFGFCSMPLHHFRGVIGVLFSDCKESFSALLCSMFLLSVLVYFPLFWLVK